MCPLDSSYITLEFNDHYVIQPTINFSYEVNYRRNLIGEEGFLVEESFEYNSGTNPHFLTIEELREMNK